MQHKHLGQQESGTRIRLEFLVPCWYPKPMPPSPRVLIISPAAAEANNGNWHTAWRWSQMLRPAFDVSIAQTWNGEPFDVMLALHARRSADAITRWAQANFHRKGAPHSAPGLGVVLTGTDLYRDIQTDAAAGGGGNEGVPGRGQGQQAQGMTGGCGIENHVIETGGRRGVTEQCREFVEGRDLNGARARKLLFHTGNGGDRQHAPVGRHHAFAIGLRRSFRVDVEGVQGVCFGDQCRRRAQRHAQHFIQIRSRVGADDQHAFAGLPKE